LDSSSVVTHPLFYTCKTPGDAQRKHAALIDILEKSSRDDVNT
jgi:hypothetical protein